MQIEIDCVGSYHTVIPIILMECDCQYKRNSILNIIPFMKLG